MTMNKQLQIVPNASTSPGERFWEWRPRMETGDAEILLYGYISEYSWLEDAVTPRLFEDDLKAFGAGKPVTVRINSGGGDVFAASAIRSILCAYPAAVSVHIDGVCASAAVTVALAGDEIVIQDSAYMLVHFPGYSYLDGWLDASVLRDFAHNLDAISDSVIDIYAARTGLERERVIELMAEHIWMNAKTAVQNGFAHRIDTGRPVPRNQSIKDLLMRCDGNVPSCLMETQTDVDTATNEQAELLRGRVLRILSAEERL